MNPKLTMRERTVVSEKTGQKLGKNQSVNQTQARRTMREKTVDSEKTG
jgi:hypothetical protein